MQNVHLRSVNASRASERGVITARYPAEWAEGERTCGMLSDAEYRAWNVARVSMLVDLERRREFAVAGVEPLERRRRGPTPRRFARRAAA